MIEWNYSSTYSSSEPVSIQAWVCSENICFKYQIFIIEYWRVLWTMHINLMF